MPPSAPILETLGDGAMPCAGETGPVAAAQPGPAVGDSMLFCGLNVSCPASVATALWEPPSVRDVVFCISTVLLCLLESLSTQPSAVPSSSWDSLLLMGKLRPGFCFFSRACSRVSTRLPPPEGTGHCERGSESGLVARDKDQQANCTRGTGLHATPMPGVRSSGCLPGWGRQSPSRE